MEHLAAANPCRPHHRPHRHRGLADHRCVVLTKVKNQPLVLVGTMVLCCTVAGDHSVRRVISPARP